MRLYNKKRDTSNSIFGIKKQRRQEMERKSLKIGVILLVMGVFLLGSQLAMAQKPGGAIDVRIVRIYGAGEGDKAAAQIEPKTAWIGRNTTLVWANMSPVDIKINFTKGHACKHATTAAWRFKMDETTQCFVTTDAITPGDTASANFHEVGEYEYEVEYIGKDYKEKGVVKVSKESADEILRY
jgi:hypothetical protein